jgi:hypothetical protein
LRSRRPNRRSSHADFHGVFLVFLHGREPRIRDAVLVEVVLRLMPLEVHSTGMRTRRVRSRVAAVMKSGCRIGGSYFADPAEQWRLSVLPSRVNRAIRRRHSGRRRANPPLNPADS